MEEYKEDKIRSHNILHILCVKALKIIFSLYIRHKMSKNEQRTEHYIKFRITKWSDMDKFIKFLNEYEKVFLVSENESSNHHYQGMCKKTTKKPCITKNVVDNFRRKLKENQDLKGNKDFSVGEITDTPEIYLRYLCKGGGSSSPPAVVSNNILLESEVLLNHHTFWEENEKLQTNKGNRKYDKIKDYEISQKWEEKQDEIKWAMKIILYHDENNLLIPDDYQIKKMVQTYMIKDSKKKDESAFNIAKRIYQNIY